MGRKEEMCPLTFRALSLEIITKYGRDYALAYSDGSSIGGPENSGYVIYILWSVGTSHICGPVGKTREREQTVLHVMSECREMIGDRPRGWPNKPVNEIIWRRDRVAMITAAKIIRTFLGEPCSKQETRLRHLSQKKGWQPPARRGEQSPRNARLLFYIGNLI
ncbi:hypothetical protein PoB_006992500 [Plakobranchus ocellatus]|uniref:Uncharacterized protein n=1 Tax=Plakobranchus ocellatus TaxID=259542 RepID=A0AAV4DH05_9GAST|nr:hypothetical protein PoB_006992500 [Plakobranchus ocellatus]